MVLVLFMTFDVCINDFNKVITVLVFFMSNACVIENPLCFIFITYYLVAFLILYSYNQERNIVGIFYNDDDEHKHLL